MRYGLNEGVREGLAIEIKTSRPESVAGVVRRMGALRDPPGALLMENSANLFAQEARHCCAHHGIELRDVQPDKPSQNAYDEVVSCTFLGEMLDAYVFDDLVQVREISAGRSKPNNNERAHEALESVPERASGR